MALPATWCPPGQPRLVEELMAHLPRADLGQGVVEGIHLLRVQVETSEEGAGPRRQGSVEYVYIYIYIYIYMYVHKFIIHTCMYISVYLHMFNMFSFLKATQTH